MGVLQNVTCGPCQEGVLQVSGETSDAIWLWVGPTTFASPSGQDVEEYTYTLWIPIGDAVEQRTLSDVKALYD